MWSGAKPALVPRQSRMGSGRKWKKLGGGWRASRYQCFLLQQAPASGAVSWSKAPNLCHLCGISRVALTSDLSVSLSLQDQYSADLYHFATKEEDYANYFIRVSCDGSTFFPLTTKHNFISQFLANSPRLLFLPPQLLELQAEYHKNSHEFLDKNISELKENHSQKGGSHQSVHFFAALSFAIFLLVFLLPLCTYLIPQGHR